MNAELEKLVLEKFEKTLKLIQGDYPSASPVYKRSSFVVGAQDMVMSFANDLPFSEKIAFAKKVDALRDSIFPPEKKEKETSPISRDDAERIHNMHAAAWKAISTHMSLAERDFNELPDDIKRKSVALWVLFSKVKDERKKIDKFIDSIPE